MLFGFVDQINISDVIFIEKVWIDVDNLAFYLERI